MSEEVRAPRTQAQNLAPLRRGPFTREGLAGFWSGTLIAHLLALQVELGAWELVVSLQEGGAPLQARP